MKRFQRWSASSARSADGGPGRPPGRLPANPTSGGPTGSSPGPSGTRAALPGNGGPSRSGLREREGGLGMGSIKKNRIMWSVNYYALVTKIHYKALCLVLVSLSICVILNVNVDIVQYGLFKH